MGTMNPLADRFWPKVDKRGPDECWPWLGSKDKNGYGRIHVGPGRSDSALVSHVALKLAGRPVGKRKARHTCDNPPCCNPRHLRRGTQADNVRDMVRRGRTALGSRLPQAKLTETAVVRMRARRATGELCRWRMRSGYRRRRCLRCAQGRRGGTCDEPF